MTNMMTPMTQTHAINKLDMSKAVVLIGPPQDKYNVEMWTRYLTASLTTASETAREILPVNYWDLPNGLEGTKFKVAYMLPGWKYDRMARMAWQDATTHELEIVYV